MSGSADLEIKVTGDVSGGVTGLKTVQSELGKTVIAAQKTDSSLQTFGSHLNTVAKTSSQSIFTLTEKLRVLESNVFTEKSTARIASFNKQIQATKSEIERLSNVGKTGFNELGDAIEKTNNPLTKAFSGLRRLAFILPGIGIAGLFNLAFEGIEKFAEYLLKVGDNASLTKLNLQNLNDVMADANKQAGGQITDLKILYSAATDVNLTMKERLAAVRALQTEFPDFFKNIRNETILNGGAKDSYDALTLSILATSRAKATKDKLDELEARRLDIAFQKQKILNATANETAKVKPSTQKFSEFQGTADEFVLSRTLAGQKKIIEARKQNALQQQEINDKSLKDQEDFLIKFAGLDKLAKVTEGQNKPQKTKKDIETISSNIEKLNRQIALLSAEEIVFKTDKAKEKISDIENTIKHLVDKFKLAPDNAIILELQARINTVKFEERVKEYFKNRDVTKVAIPFEILFENSPTNEATIARAKKDIQDQIGKSFSDQTEVKQKGLVFNPFANAGDVDRLLKEAELTGAGVGNSFVKGLTNAKFDKFFTETQKLFQTEGSILSRTLTDALSGIGDDIGKAIAGIKGENLFGDLFKTIGAGLQTFGKALIEYGVGLKILKTAFKTPGAAIIAGIGLEILGSIIQNSIPKFATGGKIDGPGTGKSDSILARVSKGEYIMQADSVSKFGTGFFDKLNSGFLPKFATGGLVTQLIPAQSNISQSFIQSNSVKEVPYIAKTEISGQNLRMLLTRADATYNRNN